MIKFTLRGGDPKEVTATFRNPRATDWHCYGAELASRLGEPARNLRSEGSINRAAEEMQNIILQSYEVACPLRTRTGSKRVAWWNRKLTKLRSRSRKLLNRAFKTRSDTDWASYEEVQGEYKKGIKVSEVEA